MYYLELFMNIFSFFSLLFLLYNSLRNRLFRCRVDGIEIPIPTDETKESYRRAALAEISRIKGGRRINFEKVEWQGNSLHVETKE